MDNDLRAITVLLYERSPRLAIALTKVLEKSTQIGEVVRSDNLRKVPELVGSVMPDVVVVDADGPEPPLIDVCREVNEQYGAPIVLFSTQIKQNQVRTALAVGAHSLVSWPFKPRELVMAVVHAAREPRNSTISGLAEMRQLTDADNNLKTGALAPIIEWASRDALEQVSPRLRPARKDA